MYSPSIPLFTNVVPYWGLWNEFTWYSKVLGPIPFNDKSNPLPEAGHWRYLDLNSRHNKCELILKHWKRPYSWHPWAPLFPFQLLLSQCGSLPKAKNVNARTLCPTYVSSFIASPDIYRKWPLCHKPSWFTFSDCCSGPQVSSWVSTVRRVSQEQICKSMSYVIFQQCKLRSNCSKDLR